MKISIRQGCITLAWPPSWLSWPHLQTPLSAWTSWSNVQDEKQNSARELCLHNLLTKSNDSFHNWPTSLNSHDRLIRISEVILHNLKCGCLIGGSVYLEKPVWTSSSLGEINRRPVGLVAGLCPRQETVVEPFLWSALAFWLAHTRFYLATPMWQADLNVIPKAFLSDKKYSGWVWSPIQYIHKNAFMKDLKKKDLWAARTLI